MGIVGGRVPFVRCAFFTIKNSGLLNYKICCQLFQKIAQSGHTAEEGCLTTKYSNPTRRLTSILFLSITFRIVSGWLVASVNRHEPQVKGFGTEQDGQGDHGYLDGPDGIPGHHSWAILLWETARTGMNAKNSIAVTAVDINYCYVMRLDKGICDSVFTRESSFIYLTHFYEFALSP